MRILPKQVFRFSGIKNQMKFVFLLFALAIIVVSFDSGKGALCKDCNVIVFDVDVLRAKQLGCYGNPINASPFMDSFANDSFQFLNAFSQATVTFPSDMSFITSMYPGCNGVMVPVRDSLPENIPTLAQLYDRAGYDTVWTGPLDYYQLDKLAGIGRGYNKFFDEDEWAETTNWIKGRKKFFAFFYTRITHSPYLPPLEIIKSLDPNAEVPKEIYSFDFPSMWKENKLKIFGNETMMRSILSESEFERYSKLKKNNVSYDEFAEAYNNPGIIKRAIEARTSQVTESNYWNLFNQSNPRDLALLELLYNAQILQADKMINQVVNSLKEEGLYNNTIIIIYSDHGDELFEHGFHGHRFINDETTHVPLLIRIPHQLPKKVNKIVELIDVGPTLIKATGLEPALTMQGINLLSHQKKSKAFSEQSGAYSVRNSDWRFTINPPYFTEAPYNFPKFQLLKIKEEGLGNLVNAYQKVSSSLNESLKEYAKINKQCQYKMNS